MAVSEAKIHFRSKPKPVFRRIADLHFFCATESAVEGFVDALKKLQEKGSGMLVNISDIQSIEFGNDAMNRRDD